MALLALGSVTVAADGTVTKSGECEIVYDLLYATVTATAADLGVALPTGPDSVAAKRAIGRQATVLATYVYNALTTRATAKIATTSTGLQRMPASTAENTDCKAPGTDKFLAIV